MKRRALFPQHSKFESDLCAGNPSNLACYSTPGTSAGQLMNRIYGGGGNTISPVAISSAAIPSLFSLAFTLQTNIFLWLLAAAGSAFFLDLFFLILLRRHLKKTETNTNAESRRSLFRRLSVSLLWGSTALALTTAVSITQTVSALQFSTTSLQATTIITSGLVLQVLQGLDFVFSFFFTLGVTLIVCTSGASPGSAPSAILKMCTANANSASTIKHI